MSFPCDLFVQRPISVRAVHEVRIEGPALPSSKGNLFNIYFFSSPVNERQKRFFESTNFAALLEKKSLL